MEIVLRGGGCRRSSRRRATSSGARWRSSTSGYSGLPDPGSTRGGRDGDDIGAASNRADPVKLEELYRSLRPEVIYHPAERAVDVTIQPGRGGERVRGGTCALTTRFAVQR